MFQMKAIVAWKRTAGRLALSSLQFDRRGKMIYADI
jgi:hypothetical protein